jgi:ribonuclease D
MRIITTTSELAEFAAELEKGPYAAIDTEFMRDQTYWPKLCLIQAAGTEAEAIIDPLVSDLDLQPLYGLLANHNIVKVFHAARQDIEIFHHQGGVIPDPFFDTQIAAMVCGFGDAASYETLVRKLAKAEIDKSARFTDWSRRPLSKRQLEYALADVTYLRQVYEILAKELERTGRSKWVEEEEATLQDPATYRLDPAEAWRRLKPRSGNKRFLAVLAGIAAWREREAQTRDLPRNRVLRDETLLEIAAHPPAGPEQLEHIRGLPNGYAQSRAGKALLAAVTEAMNAPPPEPLPAPSRYRREPSPAALDLLKTLLRIRATEFRVAPRLVADTGDLERIAAGETNEVAALHGWRAQVFGNDAVALCEGRLAIALEQGEAVVIPAQPSRKHETKRAPSPGGPIAATPQKTPSDSAPHRHRN